MHALSPKTRTLFALALTLCLFGAAGSQVARAQTQDDAPPPVPAGELFPPQVLKVINPADGSSLSVDLGTVLGKKPVILCYWIAGNERSEQILRGLQDRVEEAGSDKVALYALSVDRPGRGLDVIRERIAAAEITVPVLHDEDFQIGRMLRVRSAPSVTIIDREGRLRLSNGASLVQTLEYKMDLAAAVTRVANTGNLGTYGYLDRYFPVEELVGQPCPDFKAPLLSANSVERRWSNMIAEDKLNVLIFWSIDCPHCRKSLPEINAWLRDNSDGVNVVSAANVPSPKKKLETKEFCEFNRFIFPTFEDKDARIGMLYQVTTTPTILFIGPDGVIDSVMLSNLNDFGKAIEAKKRSLLAAADG